MLFRKRAKRTRRIRKLRLLALLLVLFLLAGASFSVGLITAIAGQLPNLDPKRAQAGEVDGYIYADNGKTILAVLRGSEARELVEWDDISPWMKHAIVDVEDRRFYEHHGVDLHGIMRAVWADVRHKSTVEGGSTITQQFVKNSLVHNERSISRKLKEAALAWQLESGPRHWSKTRILTAYLNTIYLGNGAYGVETASKAYFGHSAKTLSLPEAALLAGIPADPARWDPVTHPRAARERRRTVLLAMVRQDHITHADFVRANKAPLPKPEDVRVPGGPSPKAPYFTNYVKQLLVEQYGSSTVFGGGLRVRTSINLKVQQAARDAIAKWLTWTGAPSAALVALDPRNGRVLAMVGGNNFRKSQFNLAVQGERQPGSSFKPFVLATALQQGIAPGTTLVSKPVTLYLDGTTWPVRNYEGSYLGTIDLQQATIHSDNSVFAQLTRIVGPGNVVQTAHRLGIASPLEPFLSIGLGGQAVNPLEMARAYSAFANGGFRIDGSIDKLRNHPRAILAVGRKTSTNFRLRRPRCGLQQAQSETGAARGHGRGGELDPSARRDPGHRPAGRASGPPGRRQDRHDRELRRRLVRRLHAATRHGRVGRISAQADPDDDRVPRRTRSGRHLPRDDLEDVHGEGAQAARRPRRARRCSTSRRRRRCTARPSGSRCARESSSATTAAAARRRRSSSSPDDRSRGSRDCKPNEVEVPRVVGNPIRIALQRLVAQPLTPSYVYKPAKPGQRLNVVLAQYPSHGTLSSYDARDARRSARAPRSRAERRRAQAAVMRARRCGSWSLNGRVVRFARGKPGRVLAQKPRAGVAAARGLEVRLIVGKGG